MRTGITIRNPWGIFWQAEAHVHPTGEEAKAFGDARILSASHTGKKHIRLNRAIEEGIRLRERLVEQYTPKESA